MHLSENDAVLISVCEPLNYIHQDTKSARLIAVCKRSITLNKFGKRARGCCVHVFLVVTRYTECFNKQFVKHFLFYQSNCIPFFNIRFLFCQSIDCILIPYGVLMKVQCVIEGYLALGALHLFNVYHICNILTCTSTHLKWPRILTIY